MPEVAIEDVLLRSYQDEDWQDVQNFIKKYWRENHPMCQKSLFDWQHKGFGGSDTKSMILEYKNKIIGFRGFIPGLYQVPTLSGGMEVIHGAASAMWSVAEEYRGGQLGILMQIKTMNELSVLTGSGSTPSTSRLFYQQCGFSILSPTNRYVLPLNSCIYQNLLAKSVDLICVEKWVEQYEKGRNFVEPSNLDAEAAAEVWEKTTFPQALFSLYRNVDFWKWRYIESSGFQYIFFGAPKISGMIVARVETIISETNKEMNNKKIFRIIEILPKNSKIWNGEEDTNLIDLFHGAIDWAIQEGCIAADFYCSTQRFEPVLNSVGFKKYDPKEDPITSLALMFQPLKFIGQEIDVFFGVNVGNKYQVPASFNNVYMVKSDGDQDRPNILF
jgi:hypothetical protein